MKEYNDCINTGDSMQSDSEIIIETIKVLRHIELRMMHGEIIYAHRELMSILDRLKRHSISQPDKENDS